MSHATMSITKPARSVGAALLLALLVCLLFGRWVALVPGVGIENRELEYLLTRDATPSPLGVFGRPILVGITLLLGSLALGFRRRTFGGWVLAVAWGGALLLAAAQIVQAARFARAYEANVTRVFEQAARPTTQPAWSGVYGTGDLAGRKTALASDGRMASIRWVGDGLSNVAW
jgi:hypothetical protein